MTHIEFFEVGGAVRDRFLGIQSKDLDYCVTGVSTYEELGELLIEKFNFQKVIKYEDKLVWRGQDSKGVWSDFVWARKDGPYIDGVMLNCTPGTLLDDLARRDFTINAMAVNCKGDLIDPHKGLQDLEDHILRTVGDPVDRFTEDPRRLTRGLRFMVKYSLTMDSSTYNCYFNPKVVCPLGQPKYKDMVRLELNKALQINPVFTMDFILKSDIFSAVLFDSQYLGLNLVSTSAKL